MHACLDLQGWETLGVSSVSDFGFRFDSARAAARLTQAWSERSSSVVERTEVDPSADEFDLGVGEV